MSVANKFNLNVLRRHDGSALSILDSTSYVVLYQHNGSTWVKDGIEGTLFIYCRKSDTKPYGIFILNRNGVDNFADDLPDDDDVELVPEFIIFRSPRSAKAYGIWVFEKEHRHRIGQRLLDLAQQKKKIHQQPSPHSSSSPSQGRTVLVSPAASAKTRKGSLDLAMETVQEGRKQHVKPQARHRMSPADAPAPYRILSNATVIRSSAMSENMVVSVPPETTRHASNLPFGRLHHDDLPSLADQNTDGTPRLPMEHLQLKSPTKPLGGTKALGVLVPGAFRLPVSRTIRPDMLKDGMKGRVKGPLVPRMVSVTKSASPREVPLFADTEQAQANSSIDVFEDLFAPISAPRSLPNRIDPTSLQLVAHSKLRSGMSRNEFVREILTLLHVCGHAVQTPVVVLSDALQTNSAFVDALYQRYQENIADSSSY